MSATRRLSVTAVAVTYLQLVFGGIVRISGSGMGCGDHWPKCNGSWIPPFDQPTVMIEWTHRLLALLVVLTVGASAWVARRAARSNEAVRPVARSSATGFALVIAVALLGMITVKLGNTALATVAHWTLAMSLLGVLVATAVRAGALGGESAVSQGGTPRSARTIGAGAALAFIVVVLGGLLAKTFGTEPAASVIVAHVVFALLLPLHVVAITISMGRRDGESETVRQALAIAAGITVLQVFIGLSMYTMHMPTGLRVVHQATGVAVWMTLFLAAYLASTAARTR